MLIADIEDRRVDGVLHIINVFDIFEVLFDN